MTEGEQDPGLPTQSIWDIPYEDLVFKETIGKGSFGSVFKGTYLGVDVAIKKIEKADDPEYLKYIDREVSMLQSIRHPFIVQFSGICVHASGLYIITEFVSGGDVRKLLKTEPNLSWKKKLRISADLAKAMLFLHSKKIIHRDLKSKNILLDEHGRIRLCDFGFARMTENKRNKHMTMCGTEGWVAPEILLGMSYDTSCDVFSYGVVVAELITGKKPGVDIWIRTAENCFDINPDELRAKALPGCPSRLLEMCIECCQYEPLLRPKFDDILHNIAAIEAAVETAEKQALLKAQQQAQAQQQPQSPTMNPMVRASTAPINGAGGGRAASPTSPPAVSSPPNERNNNSHLPGGGVARHNTVASINQPGRRSSAILGALRTNSASQLQYQSPTSPTNDRVSTSPRAQGSVLGSGSTWKMATKTRLGAKPVLVPITGMHLFKMVERATTDYYYDVQYIQDLLLSYRCFSTPKQLLEVILQRYQAQPPDNTSSSELENWHKSQKVIQLRCLIFIKRWIDGYHVDFEEYGMEELLAAFDKIAHLPPPEDTRFTALLSRKRDPPPSPMSPTLPVLPQPWFPNQTGSGNPDIETYDAQSLEVARQISLLQGQLYHAIHPREYLQYCLERAGVPQGTSCWVEDQEHPSSPSLANQALAPNVHALSSWSHRLTNVVAGDIVKFENKARRINTLDKWIDIAVHCAQLKNYDAVFCIMDAIRHPSIERLSETFKGLSNATLKNLDFLKNLVSKTQDYKQYHETFAAASPPVIPYFENVLDELWFLECSSPKVLPGGIVNFFHYRTIARKVFTYQQTLPTPYQFRPVPPIQKLLLRPAEDLLDDTQLRHRSMMREESAYY